METPLVYESTAIRIIDDCAMPSRCDSTLKVQLADPRALSRAGNANGLNVQ